MGQLDQDRQNLQSTKDVDLNIDAFPVQENMKTLDCYYAIVTMPSKGKTHTDKTGRFLCQSSRDNNYIFVCYDYDANAILVQPMQNREIDTITECHLVMQY